MKGPALSPTIYIARPIDLSKLTPDQQCTLSDAKQLLVSQGWTIYEPARAWTIGQGAQPHSKLQEINNYALTHADALLAFWPELPGIGVATEIQLADIHRIPIHVVSKVADVSWALAGLEHAVCAWQFDAVDEHLLHARAEKRSAVARRGLPLATLPTLVLDGAQLPTRGYEGDAGFDLYVSQDTVIPPDAVTDVPCGIAIELPDGIWGLITGRSSTLRKHNLLVSNGIIDTGWRGELFAGIKNLDFEQEFHAKKGMRLAQLIPLPNVAKSLTPRAVETLSGSDRGTLGFGSTGE